MNKKIAPLPAGFPSAPKGRKREKENGHSKLVLGPRVQRRENVGGSLNLWSPQMFSHLVIRFFPFDDSNIVYKKRFVKCFVKKKFSIVSCV